MKNCLITGGGSKFGAQLTEQLLAQNYHVYLMTQNPTPWADNPQVTVINVDWKTLRLNDIRNCLPPCEHIDLVFFNHNSSSLNLEKFKKSTIHNISDWQQSYFVACQFPFYLVHALRNKINADTKIGWMLTDLITNPSTNQIGYADYIGNKFTNACIMKSFSLTFPACFFGIYPDGGVVQEASSKSQNIVKLIVNTTTSELNGNIFSTQGEILDFYENTKTQPQEADPS